MGKREEVRATKCEFKCFEKEDEPNKKGPERNESSI